MESSHASQSRRVDSPPMQDENAFSSCYMPDMNVVNGEAEETNMCDVNNKLVATFGGHLSDMVRIEDLFHIHIYKYIIISYIYLSGKY